MSDFIFSTGKGNVWRVLYLQDAVPLGGRILVGPSPPPCGILFPSLLTSLGRFCFSFMLVFPCEPRCATRLPLMADGFQRGP